MAEGWPIFAEWNKPKPYVAPPPPDSYLRRFNAETAAFMRRIGAKPIDSEGESDSIASSAISDFVRLL